MSDEHVRKPGQEWQSGSGPDEPRLTIEPLPGGPKPPRWLRDLSPRLVLNVLSIVAAVALGVVGASALRARWPLGATAAPTATVAVRPPSGSVVSGQGWTVAGPRFAQRIAFAPSTPATAYVCGPEQGTAPGTLAVRVAVSGDFGTTWHVLGSQFAGEWCDLTVNPLDAQDVMLITQTCTACPNLAPMQLWRTLDGGTHWDAWSLPVRPLDGRRDFSGYQWAWAGSTLYIAPYVGTTPSYALLAASVGAQPFVWVGQNGLFANEPAYANINTLLGLGDALYVEFDCGLGCPEQFLTVMRTRDHGASWSPFAPALQGVAIYLAAAGTDGRTLIGEEAQNAPQSVSSRTYVRSVDGGMTWQPLPAFSGTLVPLDLAAAPDGTLYAELWDVKGSPESAAQAGIYRLAERGTGWTRVAPFPGAASGPVMLSWDTAGHPRSLWGEAQQQSYPGQVVSGIEFHAP